MDGAPQLQFVRAAFAMETGDAERIGVATVAHILPSGAGGADSALAQHYSGLHAALEMLEGRVQTVVAHVIEMAAGRVPLDHGVVRQVSGLLHQLPTMEGAKFGVELMTEFSDAAMLTLLAVMTKGVDACHELVGKSHVAYENFFKLSK